MEAFWIEGLYRPKGAGKKSGKPGQSPQGSLEPYAKMIWANSPDEAVRLVMDELSGVVWVEGPRLGRKSEEKRMHDLGAPQLPGFGTPAKMTSGSRKK